MAAAAADGVQQLDQLADAARLRQVVAHAHDGGADPANRLVERVAHHRREAFGRFHDQVQQDAPAAQPDLLLLPRQLGLGLVHPALRRETHAGPLVQHPVHRGEADARLQRDLLHADGVRHPRLSLPVDRGLADCGLLLRCF